MDLYAVILGEMHLNTKVSSPPQNNHLINSLKKSFISHSFQPVDVLSTPSVTRNVHRPATLLGAALSL